MNIFIFCASIAFFFGKTHPSSCPPCELKLVSCFDLWPPLAILGTCSSDQTWKACYNLGELTSCCCAPLIPTAIESITTTRAPSTQQCSECTSASNNCYLTDPFIPSLGYCLSGFDFYGCYSQSADIISCCCRPNIQPDCTTSHYE